MAFQTTPTLNRIKHIKGWKNSSFPNKKNIYTIEIVLYLKIYLLITAYLNLNGFKLIRCYLYFIENNTKLLHLIITRDRKWKIQKKRKFSADASQIFFPKQRKTISLLYSILNKKKGSNFMEKNTIKKIRINQHWVSKLRIFDWTPFFKKNKQARYKTFMQTNKLFLRHKKILHKWTTSNHIMPLENKLQFNLLLKQSSRIFLNNFRHQKHDGTSIKTILHIYNQLKKYLHHKYITLLTLKQKYRKQKKILKHTFFNQKKTQNNIFNYYPTIKKNTEKAKSKTFWTELQTLFRNIARMQFKKQAAIKEKSLKSFVYPKTQFYKIRTKIQRKYYYFFHEIYYIWMHLKKKELLLKSDKYKNRELTKISFLLPQNRCEKKKSTFIKEIQKKKSVMSYFSAEEKTLIQAPYLYRQRMLLVKLLNTAYENKKKIYKFKLIKERTFPHLIKLFKSVRFKKKTESRQTKQKLIHANNKEIFVTNKSKIFDEKINDDKNYRAYKNILSLKKRINPNIVPPQIGIHNLATQKPTILKYRVQYRTRHKEFVTFTTKQYLKHIISNFLQHYLHLNFTIKLTTLNNPIRDKKYHYVCFPLKKDRNKEFNPKLRFRKKMKIRNISGQWIKNSHKHKIRYLSINEKTWRFFNKTLRINEQKKELKQLLTQLKKNTTFRTHQLISEKAPTQKNVWLKKIYLLKQKLKIMLTKKEPDFAKKVLLKKSKMISPLLPFTKDISSLNRINKVKADMNIVYLFAKYMEPQLLADYIVKILEITKKHWQATTQITHILKNIHSNKNIIYRIGIFGRFNSTEKAKKIYFTLGNMQAQTFNKKVNFASAQSRPSIGTIGVKIWTYW